MEELPIYIMHLIRDGDPEGLSGLLIAVILVCFYVIIRLYMSGNITGLTNDSITCLFALAAILFFVTLYRPHSNYTGASAREIARLKDENTRLASSFSEAEESLIRLSSDKESISAENSNLKAEIARLKSEMASGSQALMLSGDNESAMKAEYLADKLAEETSLRTKAEQESARLTEEVAALRGKLAGAEETASRFRESWQATLLEKDKIALDYDNAKKESKRMNEEISGLASKYQSALDIAEYLFYESSYDGDNAEQYFSEAEKFLREKAREGYAEAQFYLGYMLDPNHDKITRSYKSLCQNADESKEMYSKAAMQGHTAAQFELANIFFREKNYAEALKWYRTVANKGNSDIHQEAQYSIGFMQGRGYISGVEGTRSWKKFNEGLKDGSARK